MSVLILLGGKGVFPDPGPLRPVFKLVSLRLLSAGSLVTLLRSFCFVLLVWFGLLKAHFHPNLDTWERESSCALLSVLPSDVSRGVYE